MKNFFISYSFEDGDFTNWLSRKFNDAGIIHWYDPMSGEFTPFNLIDKKLDDATDMVVVVSKETLDSQRVFNELMSAILSGKNIVVVRMGNFILPTTWKNLLSNDFVTTINANNISDVDIFMHDLRPRAEDKTPVDPEDDEDVFRLMEGNDESVQFTTYHPKEIVPEKWYKLLSYIHLPKAVEDIQEDSQKILGEDAKKFGRGRGEATDTILRDAEITVIPEMAGFRFNPPQQILYWLEDWHRADFRMQANPNDPEFQLDKAFNGRVAFYVGPILVAETKIWAYVSEDADQTLIDLPDTSATAEPYRDIFISYSHDDTHIVEAVENHIATLGDHMLRDVHDLRSGEPWNPRLLEMIEDADIFQLFWSYSAKESPYVEQEWRHALAQDRSHFIRPVYWENPMPTPPSELGHIHFKQMKV